MKDVDKPRVFDACKDCEDVGRAQQNVDAATFETVSITPTRGQIVVQAVALGWRPR